MIKDYQEIVLGISLIFMIVILLIVIAFLYQSRKRNQALVRKLRRSNSMMRNLFMEKESIYSFHSDILLLNNWVVDLNTGALLSAIYGNGKGYNVWNPNIKNIDDNLMDLIHPKDKERIKEFVNRCREKKTDHFEVFFRIQIERVNDINSDSSKPGAIHYKWWYARAVVQNRTTAYGEPYKVLMGVSIEIEGLNKIVMKLEEKSKS